MRRSAHTVLVFVVCSAAWAAESPVAVSPGDASKLALVEGECPTFSWGEVEGARSYELVVYRIGEEGEEAKPVLRETFAGSVSGWTPSLDRCLERGGRYAWSVRAVGAKGETEWSEAALFQVTTGPSEAELEEALVVVQIYLEEQESGVGEEPSGVSPDSTAARSRPGRSAAAEEPGTISASGPLPESPAGPVDAIIVGGRLVETKADGPCYPAPGDPNSNHRFIPCNNGTVTDTVTGFVWLKDFNCKGSLNWLDAQDAAARMADGQCGLSDGSQAGDWHLPTRAQWEALVRFARDRLRCTGTPPCDPDPGDAPTLTNDPGDQCLAAGPTSFINVTPEVYWTAESDESDLSKAWVVSLCDGTMVSVSHDSLGDFSVGYSGIQL